MRIDLNYAAQTPEPNRTGQNGASAANSAASNVASGEDRAQLSGDGTVLRLVAQAVQLPEIRQERVQSLRSAIQGGSFQLSPEKTAAAVFDSLVRGSAA
jgi:flagellar biosynthesis anti-sigma factor FlgM